MEMRWGLFLLIFALAAGTAPAPAQEGMPMGKPGPVQPATPAKATKAAARHHKAHARRARHHLAKTAPATRKVPLPPPAPKSVAKSITRTAPAASAPLPQAKAGEMKTAAAPFTTASIPPVAGIPPDERRKIQAALIWAGDYAGTGKGENPLVAAVKKFQKRHKAKVTGELTPAQRATLLAAAHNHEDAFGWSVVVDPATGIRIGLPTKLVPHAHDAARGTRWSSAHGEIQIETFRIKEPGLKLSDLFAQEKREPRTRKIERSVLNDDNFFISGMQGLKYFSVRAEMRDGEIRGFTMLYDQAMEGIVAPVMVAMASAFAPFPERSAPFAVLAKSVEYGTGLIVSGEGHIVTRRKITDGCQVIVVPGLGNADRLAEDKTDGLALLRVYGQHKLSALTFAAAAPQAAALTLIGIPDPKEQNGREKLTAVKARLAGTAIELYQPVPVAGFSGAAALDPQGHVLGMMATRNAVVASNAPTAPPVWLVRASTIRAFLAAHHVPQATTPASEARDAVVRVICVRK